MPEKKFSLDECRREIDKIDVELARLFRRRAEISEQIAEYKFENNLPIVDGRRETEIIDVLGRKYDGDELTKPAYLRFVRNIIDQSCDIQKHITANKKTTADTEYIHVDLGADGYDITVGKGLLDQADKILNLDRKVLIVTDGGVATEYARKLASRCALSAVVAIEPGESGKSFQSVERLCHYMLACEMDRHDCLVAVGGGVICDICGLAASLYMRGIDFYAVPTSLLAQLDASVGGKNGVNLHSVKNIVGTIRQPKAVLIDTDTLSTLPERHFSNGLAEAVKMSLTHDRDLFELFERLSYDEIKENIKEIIIRSLKIKCGVVVRDEHEAGERKSLNFGHTLGHGIEVSSQLLHGESVAVGMLPFCAADVRLRLISVLEKLRLPIHATFDKTVALDAVMHDKKSCGDGIATVFVPEVGRYEFAVKNSQELDLLLEEALAK